MAVLGFAGFDSYGTTTTGLSTDWAITGLGFSILAGGRRGTNALRISSSTSSLTNFYKAFGSNKTRCGIGFSIKFDTSVTDSTEHFAGIADGASNNQLTLHRTITTGALNLYRGNSSAGTLLGTASVALAANTEYYIELWATIADSGSYELRVDGVNVLSATGVDTSSTANQFATGIRLGRLASSSNNSMAVYYDDAYWADDTGSSANTFLGAVRVDQLAMPTASGNYAEFTPSTGTNHALLIDEMPPNTTDYVDGGTVGLRDTFAFGDLPALTSQTIYAVQVKAYGLKDDAGARTVGGIARLSGTDANSDNTGTLTTTAAYYNLLHTTKPGGGAWTEADVNAAEFGVRVAS